LFMHRVAGEPARPEARASAAALCVERLMARRGNRARRGETGTDALAPAREAREVMETDRAGENDVIVFDERAVKFDGCAVLGHTELDVLRRIIRIVIERAQALRDEGREQCVLLLRGDGAMYAGGEEDPQVRRRDAELN